MIMARKTAKTQLFSTLRRALGLAIEAEKSGLPTELFLAELEMKRADRRRFIKNAGAALAIGSVVGPLAFCKNAPAVPGKPGQSPAGSKQRIAIIGAGMAGLNTLHHLKKAGLDATIYESSGRTSGRIFSVQNAMGEGTWAEFGAEFIDTNHADMWALAKEFDIELIDYAQASEAKLEAEAFYFEGKHRSLKQVVTAFRKFAPKLKADIDAMPEVVNYATTDARAKAIDNMNLTQYLTSIGAKAQPGQTNTISSAPHTSISNRSTALSLPARDRFSSSSFASSSSSVIPGDHPYAANTASSSLRWTLASQVGRSL